MNAASERVAFPLTFLFRREDDQWVSLACEVDVASCGETLEAARDGLQDAVELYVSYMLQNGMRESISRPVPKDLLTEFASEAADSLQVERHTLLVLLQAAPEMEFIPTGIGPTVCDLILPVVTTR